MLRALLAAFLASLGCAGCSLPSLPALPTIPTPWSSSDKEPPRAAGRSINASLPDGAEPLAPPAATGSESRSLAAGQPRQDGTISGLYRSSHALVIGNDAYKGGAREWPRLGKAVSDAQMVRDALEQHGFIVTFLSNVSSTELKAAIRNFFIKNGADRDARLFVWFAGHGHTANAEGYLVPVDAPHPDQDVEFRLLAVSMREVAGWMREARSKHILAVFDSCFSGSIFRATRNAQVPSSAILHYAQHPIRQIITSGSAQQEVLDDGFFAQAFVRAITGHDPTADQQRDGYVTGHELATFLRHKITDRNGGRQSPQYGEIVDNDSERGDFVFRVGNAAPAVAAAGGVTLASARADDLQSRPRLPSFEARRVYVAPVFGLTAEGNHELREAIRKRLGRDGIEVWDADSDVAFKLHTVVTIRSVALLVDEVTVQWRLLDKGRGQIANLQQVSEVMTGSRAQRFGTSAADGAADYAVKRLTRYLAAP